MSNWKVLTPVSDTTDTIKLRLMSPAKCFLYSHKKPDVISNTLPIFGLLSSTYWLSKAIGNQNGLVKGSYYYSEEEAGVSTNKKYIKLWSFLL